MAEIPPIASDGRKDYQISDIRGDGRPRPSGGARLRSVDLVRVEGGEGMPGQPRAAAPTRLYRVVLFSAISFLIFSTNSAAGVSSVFSFPRVRTFTFPDSASLSPTTSRNGTFCSACSRIFAFIFSLR